MMSNRLTYCFLVSSVGVVCPTLVSGQNAVRPQKPNLLFIWTDQQNASTMAVYGNRQFIVPNLNALADESVVFADNHVVQPVSTPSRGTIMTGLWPMQHGAQSNNSPLNTDVKTLPEIVAERGYVAGYFGKWHLGDEVFVQHGFDEFESVEDMYIDYYSSGRDRSARSDYHRFLVDAGFKPDDTKHNLFSRKFVTTLPYEYSKPAYLATAAESFLERHRSEPFILYVNYLEPHTPFDGPFNDLHSAEQLELPAAVDCPLTQDDPIRYRARVRKNSVEKLQTMNQHYAGLCHSVDCSVGRILHVLDSLGLRDNTIVVFTSDHGEMMGAHGLVNKSVMYEQALRVPLMMRIPWMFDSQRIVKQRVSSIDIVPTLLELIGCDDNAKGLPGESLMPLTRGQNRGDYDGWVYAVWNPNDDDKKALKINGLSAEQLDYYNDASFRTVISLDGWKLTMSDRDRNQLFNLNSDPDECHNLYYTGTYDKQIERLAKRLEQWQRKQNDELKLKR